jgi:hypothetical protein
MKIAVLNPGGRDAEQAFPDGAGAPDDHAHAPVNFHGYAACTSGHFCRKDDALPEGIGGVLLLLRQELKSARQAMLEIRAARKGPVIVSLKETGQHQVAQLLAKPSRLELFQKVCARADGAVAATEELLPIYRAAGVREVEFIPTPYPVEDERWNFAHPYEDRRGIFIGTREFTVPTRNHAAALLAIKPLAEAMGEPVTVVNTDGWTGRRLLARLGYGEGMLNVLEKRLPYPRYLRLMSRHKLVFQLDASAVPGQVAGDALLCRMPCIGGNGTTERLVFPEWCGHGRSPEQLFDLAARLLEHPHDCEALVEEALDRAKLSVSFTAVAKRLESFFGRFRR